VSPHPPTPTKVGADIIHDELWLSVGGRDQNFLGAVSRFSPIRIWQLTSSRFGSRRQRTQIIMNRAISATSILLFCVHCYVLRHVAGLQLQSFRGSPKRKCKSVSQSSCRPLVTWPNTSRLSLLEPLGAHKLFQLPKPRQGLSKTVPAI